MNRQLIVTDDGSHSIFVPVLDEHYHSTHGAIQESEHVFIHSGLKQCQKKKITIFEVGFGTGLNALLTLRYAQNHQCEIEYITIEKYPLVQQEFDTLNYAQRIDPTLNEFFKNMHQCRWDRPVPINPNFTIHKIEGDLRRVNIDSFPAVDVVFFDAFAPNKQPDLWNEEIYLKIYNQCNQGAMLVTYCSKGVVRRGLQQVGFRVERIPGPPGKKEMLRAIK
jgi:tRNA U34 5-methylaminomethyl-2-thiouridine-forming methyltransferase MnmC